MSGNITNPGFATADSLLGARSSHAAGQGLADEDAELQTRRNGRAPSNTESELCLGTEAQAGLG